MNSYPVILYSDDPWDVSLQSAEDQQHNMRLENI